MAKSKIVAGLPVRNEEWILEKTLTDLSEYVDEIVAVDDGSTDRTPEILRSFKKVTAIHTNPPGTYPFHNAQESDNRNMVLDLARARGADWVLQIDADEMFEDQIKFMLPRLIRRGCSTKFQICHLWNSTDTFRVDGDWGEFVRYRLFRLRNMKRLRFSKQPLIAKPRAFDRQNVWKSNIKIIHYGWISEAVRERSLRRYYEVYKQQNHRKNLRHVGWERFKNSRKLQSRLKIVDQKLNELKLMSWKEMLPNEPLDKFLLGDYEMAYVTGKKEFKI